MKGKIYEVLSLIEGEDLGPKLDFLSVITINGSDKTAATCEEIRHELVQAEKARLDGMFESGGIVTGMGSDEGSEFL